MADENTPKIALIGCGMWGRNIARNLASLNALAGVTDLNLHAAESIANNFNVPIYTIDEAIADPDIQGLAIVTDAAAHTELAINGLNAGKAVFIEKPLALNLEEARRIAIAVSRSNKPLVVGHLIRHHPGFQKMRRMIANGTIGSVFHIKARRLAPGRIREVESVLYDLCVHDLALIAAITNQAIPQQITAHGFSHITKGVEDCVTAQLSFDSGRLTAEVEASWIHPIKTHSLTAIGDRGAIVFNDVIMDWQEKLTLFQWSIQKTETSVNLDQDKGLTIPLIPSEPLREEMINFIDVIKGKALPLTDITEALYVQELLERIDHALQKQS